MLSGSGVRSTLVGAVRYAAEIDINSDTTQAKVTRLVGTQKRVLELGPATGSMSKLLRERGCQIVGIEIDPEAAAFAQEYCERVIIADIDQLDWNAALGDELFDVVVAADVLEHLKDPVSALQAVRRVLQPDGYMIVSLPNIAHISVRLALLTGSFPYSELGILDRTHLRFYTRESMEQLLDEAGFAIGYLERQERDPAWPDVPYDGAKIPPGLIETLSQDPEARTYQFIIIAYPLPRADLARIQQRFRELVYSRTEAEQRVKDLERDIHTLTQHSSFSPERELELRTMLIDTHDQLLRRDEELIKQRNEFVKAQVQPSPDAEELVRLRQELADLQNSASQFRTLYKDTYDQLHSRDEELISLRQELTRHTEELSKIRGELFVAKETLNWIQNSKSWQLVNRSWQLRRQIKRLFR